MKLHIYRGKNLIHASADGKVLGCDASLLNSGYILQGIEDIDIIGLAERVTCKKCHITFHEKMMREHMQSIFKPLGEAEQIPPIPQKPMMPKPIFSYTDTEEKPETIDELLEKYSPYPEVIPVLETQENNCIIFGNILTLCLDDEKTVTIPERVKIIEKSAFVRCAELTSLEIPDTVTEIRDYAFALCKNLTEITLPQTAKLGKNIFYGCSALELVKIRFPNGAVGTFSGDSAESMFEKL